MGGELFSLIGAIAAKGKAKAEFDSNTLIPNNRNKLRDIFTVGVDDAILTNMVIVLWTHVKGLWSSLPPGIANKISQVEEVEAQMFTEPSTRKPINGVHYTGLKLRGSCNPNTAHVCDFGLYMALSEPYGNDPEVRANDVSHLMNIELADMNIRVPAIIADLVVFEKTISALVVLNNILTRIKAAFDFQPALPADVMLALYRTESNLAVPHSANLYFEKIPTAYGYGGAQLMTGFDFNFDNNKLSVYVIDKDQLDTRFVTADEREATIKLNFRTSWLRIFGLDVLTMADDHKAKLVAIMKTNGMSLPAADTEATRIINALAAISIFKNDQVVLSDTNVFANSSPSSGFFPFYSAAPTNSVTFLKELFNVINIVFTTFRKNICPQKMPFATKELSTPIVLDGGDFTNYEFLSNTPTLLNQNLTLGASYLNFHAGGQMPAIIADAILHAKTSTSARFADLKQSITSSAQLSALATLDTLKLMSDHRKTVFNGTINNPHLTFINNLKNSTHLDAFDIAIIRKYESYLATKPMADRPRHLDFIKNYLVKIKWTKIGYLTIMEIRENLWANILSWLNSDAANIPRLCEFIENASFAEWPEYNLHRANLSRFMLLQDFYRRLFLS